LAERGVGEKKGLSWVTFGKGFFRPGKGHSGWEKIIIRGLSEKLAGVMHVLSCPLYIMLKVLVTGTPALLH